MIRFKDTVRIRVYSSAIEWILHCIREIDKQPCDNQPAEITVTSINDSEHSKLPKSRHYTDEAIDLRSHNFRDMQSKLYFRQRLEAMLNAHPEHKFCFTVILEDTESENEHFHVQVRRGIIFPAF